MIKLLDQHTIDQIAAGEVIERPASVVKELVENSVDAGANRITVEITDGGKSSIRVTDNGSGIPAEEVKTAFLDHATSKLRDASDLVGVSTLGFRGEALSTIAAVTDTEMITKTRDSLTGIRYQIRGGKEISCEEVGAPDGTTIVARNIFFNTPARLKFLKSAMTEGAYINDLMSHIALAKPDISVHLISGGKSIVDTSGDGDLQKTIYQIYGKEIARNLLPVQYQDASVEITGFTGKPFLAKGNRSFENYFVNGRYIKSTLVNKAIEEAYKTYVMQHRFPFTVLFLNLPPESVDVNVHPAKREFRYDHEKELFSAVYHAVSDALKEKELIPDAEADYGQRQKLYVPPVKEEEPEIVSVQKPVKTSYPSQMTTEKNPEGNSGKMPERSQADSLSILKAMLPESYLKKLSEKEKSDAGHPEQNNGQSSVREIVSPYTGTEDNSSRSGNRETTQALQEAKPVYQQQSLTDTDYLSTKALPHHHIIGQVFQTYWISEFDGALYLMDQHAAHEKVNYETFLKEFHEKKIVSQQLFPPMVLTLSGREKAAVMENLPYFQDTGFDVEDYGGNDVKISSVPVNLLGLSGREIFLEFAAELASGVQKVTEDIFVHKIATMGCKAAIKGGWDISAEEARTLIEKLMTLDNPYTCPHGRPTIIRITKEELDKKFRRIVE